MTHFILVDAKTYQISYLTFHFENLEDWMDGHNGPMWLHNGSTHP